MVDTVKEIIVKISAQKEGFESFDAAAVSVSKNIGQINAQVVQANTVQASFASRLSASSQGFVKLGQFGNTYMNVLDRIELTEISMTNALASKESAQLRYNNAVENFGVNSEQATIAANTLERAQNGVDRANIRANNSFFAIGISIVGQIPLMLEYGSKFVKMLKGVELATLLTTARIKAMAPELIILSAIAGGAYYLMTTSAMAAEDAARELAAAQTEGFGKASQAAQELIDKIEKLKGQTVSLATREANLRAEYAGAIAAINASTISDGEKKLKIDEKTYALNQGLLGLRKESAENAKNIPEIAAISQQMTTMGIQKDINGKSITGVWGAKPVTSNITPLSEGYGYAEKRIYDAVLAYQIESAKPYNVDFKFNPDQVFPTRNQIGGTSPLPIPLTVTNHITLDPATTEKILRGETITTLNTSIYGGAIQ